MKILGHSMHLEDQILPEVYGTTLNKKKVVGLS
jgi:hypothetical protein